MSASSKENASWPVSIKLVKFNILMVLGYVFKEPEGAWFSSDGNLHSLFRLIVISVLKWASIVLCRLTN